MSRELLEGLRRYSPTAQRELRDQVFTRIITLCEWILHDSALAEETAEDIIIDFLLVHVNKVKKANAIPAYLRVMTIRRCQRIKAYRDRHQELGPLPSGEASPEEALILATEGQRSAERLAHCLDQLTSKNRRLLRLRYGIGINLTEIAQGLGVSRQYVGRVIDKSLKVLRECLEGAS